MNTTLLFMKQKTRYERVRSAH